MKQLKQIVKLILENSISSSKPFLLVVKSIQNLTVEVKSLMEITLRLNDRLNQQQDVILQLCELQKELNTPQEPQVDTQLFKKSTKINQKPN